MTTLNVELFFHLLFVFILLAGIGIANAGGILIAKSSDVNSIFGTGARLARVGGMYLATPGAVLAWVFGMALLHELHFSASDAWVWLSLVAWVLLLCVIHGPLQSIARCMLKKTEGLSGPASPELLAIARARKGEIFGTIQNLLVLALLVLMVWRPGS